MSVHSPIKILAAKHAKEARKRWEEAKQRDLDRLEAERIRKLQLAELVRRTRIAVNFTEFFKYAVRFGANEKDPLYVKAVVAEYHKRPVLHDNKLVIDIDHLVGGARCIGPKSRVVGEIKTLPIGGIIGVKVYDRSGSLMLCEGGFDVDAKWNPWTKDFHVIKNATSTSIEVKLRVEDMPVIEPEKKP